MAPPATHSVGPLGLRLRAAAASVLGTGLDVGLFALCAAMLAGGQLLAARWLCAAVGALVQFALNRCWAFSARGAPRLQQAWRFALAAGISISLSTLLWLVLVRLTGLDPRLLHLAAPAAVWLCFTFPVLRLWVFRAHRCTAHRRSCDRRPTTPRRFITSRSRPA